MTNIVSKKIDILQMEHMSDDSINKNLPEKLPSASDVEHMLSTSAYNERICQVLVP